MGDDCNKENSNKYFNNVYIFKAQFELTSKEKLGKESFVSLQRSIFTFLTPK